MGKKELGGYEETTFDVPDIPAWDGTLNPEQHIHYGLMALQKMLVHEDPKIGFMQYGAQVQHIEGIARAAKKLDSDYESSIATKRTELKKANMEFYVFEFRLAQYKLELIMAACFSSIPLKTMGRA